MPHRQQQAGHYLSSHFFSQSIFLSLQKMELIIPLNVNIQKRNPKNEKNGPEQLPKNGQQHPPILKNPKYLLQNHLVFPIKSLLVDLNSILPIQLIKNLKSKNPKNFKVNKNN
jgi:hypothetical protein